MNPEHDKILAYCFFETEAGKKALIALMDFTGWANMPEPADVATSNYNNGLRAVIARINLAYLRENNPAAKPDPNPAGFR